MAYMRLNLIVRVSKWYLGDGQGLWLFFFLLEWHNYFEEKYLASQISFCAKNTHLSLLPNILVKNWFKSAQKSERINHFSQHALLIFPHRKLKNIDFNFRHLIPSFKK